MVDAPPFAKVLVANRGEIALRVIRGCRELGIPTVAVYSEADAEALHVRAADEAYGIGPAPSAQSYLRQDVILEVAKAAGVDGIHPGYGFLSENPTFARAVTEAGITFIGPPPEAMEVMGDKVSARKAMQAAGVPVVPGTTEPLADEAEAARVAAEIGYPVMLKASAGGGGKGMRAVMTADELGPALRAAQSEARNSFGDDRVYIEKLVQRPRHVEVQVFSDTHGHHLHLFERDCSIQRRHQKLVEESPCPVLRPEVRAAITTVATRAAEAIGYEGAGTVEFLYDNVTEDFYFLEMNTRLQVEHPVTELVTGVDLVHAQILVAAGHPAPFTQEELTITGHSIEVRICAEDPAENFRPAPGRIHALREPTGPGVRVDAAWYPGYEVPIHYDPMLAKLIVWGPDRLTAVRRMSRALSEFALTGIRHNLGFHKAVMNHRPFIEGTEVDTGYIARHFGEDLLLDDGNDEHAEIVMLAAAIAAHEDRKAALTGGSAPDAPAGNAWSMAGRLRALGRTR